jgi:hypothetical protein
MRDFTGMMFEFFCFVPIRMRLLFAVFLLSTTSLQCKSLRSKDSIALWLTEVRFGNNSFTFTNPKAAPYQIHNHLNQNENEKNFTSDHSVGFRYRIGFFAERQVLVS